MKNHADINLAKRGFRTTPLLSAAEKGHYPVVKWLLQNRANVNLANENMYTPLMSAVQRTHTDVVHLLIQYGARINDLSKAGNSALWIASGLGFEGLVLLLLDNGADGSLANHKLRSPLFIASSNGRLDVFKILLNVPEINVDQMDILNYTAFIAGCIKNRFL